MLKNSKVVLFRSSYKVGQARNFWTLLRTSTDEIHSVPLLVYMVAIVLKALCKYVYTVFLNIFQSSFALFFFYLHE